MKYQGTLKHRRLSTNIVTSSYVVKYKGFYIYGACYNRTHICYVDFENESFFSKSIEQVKRRINKHLKRA